jgi:serine/threonine-protein kinase
MTVESRRALGSRYELVDRLGSGAMGEVWRARDRETATDVAAKLLRSEYTQDRDILTRFVQERSILLALEHPNIVRVHDLVVEGDRLAIVMDLLEGGTLGERLRRDGTLGVREAVLVTCSVLDGLAHAHAQRTLHRDVKPDNVLLARSTELTADDVRLSDFSIARLAQDATVQATGLLGTPAYMPPELFVHGTFSAASDVYAAGIVLYELLAGRTPFAGPGNAHTVGFRHVQVAPPQLPVPADLWHVLSTMLAKDPTVRLTARAAADALRELPEATLDTPALPVQPTPESWADVPPVAPGGPLHVQHAAADLDVGMTNLHGQEVAAEPLAYGGSVETIAPRLLPSDDGVTQLGAPVDRPTAPVLTPQITAAPPGRSRRTLWIALGAAAVVLLAVAGVVVGPRVLGHSSSAGAPSAGTEAGPPTATVQLADTPTGLRTTLEAEYDPAARTAKVSYTFASSAATLDGSLLEVVPPAFGTRCPTPGEWDGGTARTLSAMIDAVPDCSYELTPGAIEKGGSVTMSTTFAVDLKGDDALQRWLGSFEKATADGLQQPRSDGAYAIQRLTGVSVDVRPVTITTGHPTPPVSYVVRPVWTAGDDQSASELFHSPGAGRGSALLQAVAGGTSGVTVTSDCGDLLVRGLAVTAVSSSSGSCALQVGIGALDPAEGSVQINGAGG